MEDLPTSKQADRDGFRYVNDQPL